MTKSPIHEARLCFFGGESPSQDRPDAPNREPPAPQDGTSQGTIEPLTQARGQAFARIVRDTIVSPQWNRPVNMLSIRQGDISRVQVRDAQTGRTIGSFEYDNQRQEVVASSS